MKHIILIFLIFVSDNLYAQSYGQDNCADCVSTGVNIGRQGVNIGTTRETSNFTNTAKQNFININNNFSVIKRDFANVNGRIEALDKRISAVESRPNDSGTDLGTDLAERIGNIELKLKEPNDLPSRVDAIESQLAQPNDLAGRVGAIETQLKQPNDNVTDQLKEITNENKQLKENYTKTVKILNEKVQTLESDTKSIKSTTQLIESNTKATTEAHNQKISVLERAIAAAKLAKQATSLADYLKLLIYGSSGLSGIALITAIYAIRKRPITKYIRSKKA